ncbi:TPA: hypothetical protein ACH3X2_013251 [Trebouxia sp. C0005]
MVKHKHITASQELRLKAVHLKQDHQDWSHSKIGKKIGCSHKFVSRWVARHQQDKGVSDQQRSGRPLKADADAQQYIYMAAQLPECSSAADLAAKIQQAKGLKLSPSSITRLLRRKGLQHLTAKVVLRGGTNTSYRGATWVCTVAHRGRPCSCRTVTVSALHGAVPTFPATSRSVTAGDLARYTLQSLKTSQFAAQSA